MEGKNKEWPSPRLFVKNHPIVLLDEATSALDSRTEADIQGALSALSSDRTSVTIAHRLGTISNCDAIVVLNSGRITERGSHSELLALEGEYKAMWDAQARNSEAEEVKEEPSEAEPQ